MGGDVKKTGKKIIDTAVEHPIETLATGGANVAVRVGADIINPKDAPSTAAPMADLAAQEAQAAAAAQAAATDEELALIRRKGRASTILNQNSLDGSTVYSARRTLLGA